MTPSQAQDVTLQGSVRQHPQYLRMYREQAGISIRELARYIAQVGAEPGQRGISHTYISLIERGKKTPPPRTIDRLLASIDAYAAERRDESAA